MEDYEVKILIHPARKHMPRNIDIINYFMSILYYIKQTA